MKWQNIPEVSTDALRHQLIPAALKQVKHHFDNRQLIHALAEIHRQALDRADRRPATAGK